MKTWKIMNMLPVFIELKLATAAMERFEAASSSCSASRSRSRSRRGSSSSSTSSSYYSESGDSSDGSESLQSLPPSSIKIANLLISQLTAFQEEAGKERKDYSVAARNGISVKRLKGVLRTPCKCALRCTASLCFKVVLSAVRLFWSMTKVAQDSLLWSMQQCQSQVEAEPHGEV